jgi:ALG6, ALG8 glycosyltransferase family
MTIAVFFPGVLVAVWAVYRRCSTRSTGPEFKPLAAPVESAIPLWPAAVALLQPALLLIDHGHFQYNCIALGLTVRCFSHHAKLRLHAQSCHAQFLERAIDRRCGDEPSQAAQ